MFQNTDKFYLHGNCEGMCARTSTVRVHTVNQLYKKLPSIWFGVLYGTYHLKAGIPRPPLRGGSVG